MRTISIEGHRNSFESRKKTMHNQIKMLKELCQVLPDAYNTEKVDYIARGIDDIIVELENTKRMLENSKENLKLKNPDNDKNNNDNEN